MSADPPPLCWSFLVLVTAQPQAANVWVTHALPLLIIILLVLLNGLFVAAEFAILGLRPTLVNQLAEEGHVVARSVKAVLADPLEQERYIATAQLGITLTSLGFGMYGGHAITGWLVWPLEYYVGLGEPAAYFVAVPLTIALLTFAHVVVGEMVPKSLALHYAERTALRLTGLMALMKRVLYPAVIGLNALSNTTLRMFGIPPATTQTRLYSPEELALLVSESHQGGLITDNEDQLIQNIFDFGERRVGQVMTPRPRIEAIPLSISESDLCALVVQSPHSRFPVYDDTIDHVVGLLLIKDFVQQQVHQPGQFNLRTLLRHTAIVPESMLVEQLLNTFKRSHVHMALVADEYGGTAGLITLEDLVEEVVGEVRDEFDHNEQPAFQEVAPGVLQVRGDVLLEDVQESTAILLPNDEQLPDVETIGGLVVALLGRLPQPGDTAEINDMVFTVEQINGMAVDTVRVTLPPAMIAQTQHQAA